MLTRPLSDRETICRIIHHELGHWLMAKNVGFGAKEITIGRTKHNSPCGSALIDPKPLIQFQQVNDIYTHLLNRTSVLCAGVIADIEWHKKYASFDYSDDDTHYLYENGIMDTTGLSDSGKIEELLYVMNGIKNLPSIDKVEIMNQRHEIITEAWNKAYKVIADNPTLLNMGKILIKNYFDNKPKSFDKCYLEKIMHSCTV
ncbi:hypothetical protein [Lelliottia amnigena]|jgi:hypothetical protein|uniref:hypothetical protein n=1 Tax=Lelliottia amnigena TaxID=61646 RepID=UPI001C246DA0|nr:hypothetical protein [Lelliottia amnigena]QXB24168.1 hypothetical protein I6L76_23170 [Lelliottia amnigena]